jgi:Ser/Thr protein kinase RdoA (MazF antagonist)
MKDYYTLTNGGRALRLRQLAIAALADYDLDVKSVRLITNDFNAIFRIDTSDGEKYVLRVCRPTETENGLPKLQSEMMWLAALRHDTDLQVPEPVKTRSGAYVTTAQVDSVPEPSHCVIFSWLPGRDIHKQITTDNMELFGAFAAHLHAHAAWWTPPDGFCIGQYDTPFPFEPVIMFDEEYRDMLPPARRELFKHTVNRVQDAINYLKASGIPVRVLHADLHRWNVKVYRGTVSAIDFQEILWGWPVQDIGITLYYFHGETEYPAWRDAFEKGYTQVSPWPESYPGEVDLFIAARGLMLANGLLTDVDPEWRAEAPGYFERTETRLRTLLNGERLQLRRW